MYVKAAPGLVIRDPVFLDLLPPEGRDVPDTPYWQKRKGDGDVVLATPPDASAAPTEQDTQSRAD
ncbi:DUF2635 domain-containing protein [Variovorax ureilyticus]|uniref:DUF2635 domain-containing protein n=1 Tax=Variovorax ureilyticus TaxID=1836198 RepID=UPI003D6685E2